MILIEMIQAGHGDAIWIEYGNDAKNLHRILIDGGTSGTYRRLKSRIRRLPKEDRHFELLVITHIDADHIAGILKLMVDDTLGVTFADIWFNGYRHLETPKRSFAQWFQGIFLPKGVRQGETLSDYLERPNLPWNEAFDGEAICIENRKNIPFRTLPGGMKLTLLSPTRKELLALKTHWKEEAERAGLFPDKRLPPKEDIDTTPSPMIFKKPLPPDVEKLAAKPFEPDKSLTNGSSIAFLAEYGKRKMLFTGDAYATVLLDSISALLPDCEPLYLDIFKIPHHGSEGNISKPLLDRIRCSNYLVSTNGAYFKHPDKTAIARIVAYGGPKADIYFNYLSKYNDIWGMSDLMEKYRYTAHYPAHDETEIALHLE